MGTICFLEVGKKTPVPGEEVGKKGSSGARMRGEKAAMKKDAQARLRENMQGREITGE